MTRAGQNCSVLQVILSQVIVGCFTNTISLCHTGEHHNIYHLDDKLVDNCNKNITNVYLVCSIQLSPGIQGFLKCIRENLLRKLRTK
jgi:hypothetical protein